MLSNTKIQQRCYKTTRNQKCYQIQTCNNVVTNIKITNAIKYENATTLLQTLKIKNNTKYKNATTLLRKFKIANATKYKNVTTLLQNKHKNQK